MRYLSFVVGSIMLSGLLTGCNHPSYPSSIIRVDEPTLMHEVRATPSPQNQETLLMNPPHFMWPDKYPHLGAVLDGVEGDNFKPTVTYRIRIASDKQFTKDVITAELAWAFYNPFKIFAPGTYYWQHAFVDAAGKEEWSPVYTFYVDDKALPFNPPSLEVMLSNLSKKHPRILLDAENWKEIIERNRTNPEAQAYITKANSCMKKPLRPLAEEIDTSNVVKLTNEVQRKSALIRESRKIVDREEAHIEGMIRAYLLTENPCYYKEAMKRLLEVISWQDSPYFAGDFNLSTILSISTSAYDAFYNLLSSKEKQILLTCIKQNGTKFYTEYVNHLENRIADNHVWQMTFRILTMAAYAVYGELDEADVWTDYCYNEWVSRMPGLFDDGGWHNGDSYFHVNLRTLVEVPAFFSRVTGFDFFSDPWYKNNAKYVIYQQPPFSKSAGHGNSHENKIQPLGNRVGYADALARECNDQWSAAYVQAITAKDPAILQSSFESKPSDLTWYRCTTTKKFPFTVHTLADMPQTHVFPETGLGTMHTSLGNYATNAMLSFRSSPYGSTSHALANQNAFNTFYGGQAIFYSSGHRTGFTDDHCMYSYRNTRAHNTILVNGMGQAIGTQGYGWIPRWYEGEEISYFVGDASNAYKPVTSPLWLERGRLSGTAYTPANGWDVNRLDFFRRHVVQLGKSGIYIVFDELQGKEPVTWTYLLHTTTLPMEVARIDANSIRITGYNKIGGVSDVHLYSAYPLADTLSTAFFSPAVDWKKRKGKKLENHWHFSATTPKVTTQRFLTIIDTHGKNRASYAIEVGNGIWKINDWTITCPLTSQSSTLHIENKEKKIYLHYDWKDEDGATLINDIIDGKKVHQKLMDKFPHLPI